MLRTFWLAEGLEMNEFLFRVKAKFGSNREKDLSIFRKTKRSVRS